MEKDLVSIIIPTYNRGNIIRETILSVLNQTYNNIEIIIIDDGSTDNTQNVIKSISDKRIKYIWQNNCGLPSIVRNKGLKIAKGSFIAFLDSDDLWLPKKLEKQIQIIKQNNKILLVSTNGLTFPEKSIFYTLNNNKIISFKELLNFNFIITSSVLMKKSVINEIGLLDENKMIKSLEDYDYWLKILDYRDQSVIVLNDVLIYYRLHESNISNFTNKNTLKLIRLYLGYKYIYNKYSKNENIDIKKIFEKKTLFIKILILKNLFFQKKEKYFLNDKSIKIKTKIAIIITNFYKKYLDYLIKTKLVKNIFIEYLCKKIYGYGI